MKKKSFLLHYKNLQCYQSTCQYFKGYKCTYKIFICPQAVEKLAIPELTAIEDKEDWEKFIKDFKY
jgi:hypothetical protein